MIGKFVDDLSVMCNRPYSYKKFQRICQIKDTVSLVYSRIKHYRQYTDKAPVICKQVSLEIKTMSETE